MATETCVLNGKTETASRSAATVHKGSLGPSPESASVIPSLPLASEIVSPVSPPSSKNQQNRRRSMTVPVNTFYPSTADTSTAKSTLSSPQEEDLPARASTPPHQINSVKKSNRFIVSKITEDVVREGGALIMPSRSSAGSSIAGSPESTRARSPLIVLSTEDKMVSPTGDLPFRPPLLTSTSVGSRSVSRRTSRDIDSVRTGNQ